MSTLNPERWRAVSPYLEQALAMPDDERAAWLASLREQNPEVAADLEMLLDEHRALVREGFLEQPPVAMYGQAARAGQTVGAYTLVSPIGQGGMGTVWLAERSDGRFQRRAAVKFLNIELLGRGGEERFKREGGILARLTHPHIAHLVDAGVSEAGQPYLVLEHVDGEHIDRYCDHHALDVEARLRLFLDVLTAVEHAHANLIVHRDIKPSNILVGSDGQVKLLDFGIAKLLEDEGESATPTIVTREGGSALTPEYAAPEQVTGGPVSTATDVYTLGVLLYLLLTGHHPAGAGPRSTADLVKAIVDTEPPRLSDVVARNRTDAAVLAANSASRATTPDRLRRLLRVDLDTIVAKALKKDPQERYISVTALAGDLRRYLRHEPIGARPDTLAYRAAKFARRNRTAVTLATLALVAIAAGLAGTMIQARRAEEQALANRRLLYVSDMNRIGQAWDAANVALVEELLERHRPAPGQEDLRSFEWYYWWRVANSSLRTLRETGPALAFSPDGTRLATAGLTEKGVKLWDPSTGRQLAALPSESYSERLAFSPDGRLIAGAGFDGTARLWDVAARRELVALKGHTEKLLGVVFSPDGTLLATASEDRTAKLWELATRRERATFTGHAEGVTAVAFSPDGKVLASASEDRTVKLWDVATGKEMASLAGHTTSVFSVVFSPDGTMLATAGGDFATHLWDVATRQKKASLRAGHGTMGVAFSPDGRMLATASYDRIARLYALPSGELVDSFRGHGASVDVVAFSPDGKVLATGGREEIVRLWDVQTPRLPATIRAHGEQVTDLSFSSDGRYLATASEDTTVVLWDASGRQKVRSFIGHAGAVLSVAFAPDGGLLASSSVDGTVKLWEVTSGKEVLTVPISVTLAGYHALDSAGAFTAFSVDGTRLATGSRDGSVSLWDVASRQQVAILRGSAGPISWAAFSPDGKTLATVGGSARLWSVAAGKELRRLDVKGPIHRVAFSPNGHLLATSGFEDRIVRLWDLATGRELATLKGHTTYFYSLAFSPDGKRVLAAGGYPTFRLWDVTTGQESISLNVSANANCAAFSPGGRTLAVGQLRGLVTWFQAATDEEVLGEVRPELARRASRGTR